MSGLQQVNIAPPHISQVPPSYPASTYPQQQGQQFIDANLQAQNAAIIAQNYRDQLFAQCAMGNHERKTEYGMCGIITAVACFPCGLICLFMDTNEKCSRCGISLDKK